jgi:hypothetical protein
VGLEVAGVEEGRALAGPRQSGRAGAAAERVAPEGPGVAGWAAPGGRVCRIPDVRRQEPLLQLLFPGICIKAVLHALQRETWLHREERENWEESRRSSHQNPDTRQAPWTATLS